MGGILAVNCCYAVCFPEIKYQINTLQIFVTMCPFGRKGMSNYYVRLLKEDVMKPIPVATRSKAWVSCRCGFESHRGHGCLSLVNVVCCQVEVSATDRSLVQRSGTECLCVLLDAIRCNNNPLDLQRVDMREIKKERKQE
jgi:hypothetical protein